MGCHSVCHSASAESGSLDACDEPIAGLGYWVVNDPHVEMLSYDFVSLDERNDFTATVPWSGDLGDFECRLEAGQLQAVPRAHYFDTPPLGRSWSRICVPEKKTGLRYSITCTNIPQTGMPGVPGSHHPQFIDVAQREHAVVETGGVRTAKAMGLRHLPSKSWQVNRGWVIAANIAADPAAWTRLLGFRDDEELREADPDTLRYRIWHIPARLARHARERVLKISPDWPWKDAFLTCWQRLCALPAPA